MLFMRKQFVSRASRYMSHLVCMRNDEPMMYSKSNKKSNKNAYNAYNKCNKYFIPNAAKCRESVCLLLGVSLPALCLEHSLLAPCILWHIELFSSSGYLQEAAPAYFESINTYRLTTCDSQAPVMQRPDTLSGKATHG